MNSPVSNGWEELFLANVEINSGGKYFYGHKLLENSGRSSTTHSCVFDGLKRRTIINALMIRLNQRLDHDIKLQEDLAPLLEIKTTIANHSLKLCYAAIVPDCDENAFCGEYNTAAELLTGYEFTNPLHTLQKLCTVVPDPDELSCLKLALARIVAAKPHSADVERLISKRVQDHIFFLFPSSYLALISLDEYNKLKATDRMSLAGLTLFNYLYVNVNMPTVDEFDPTDAVHYWMTQKDRNPHDSSTRKEQEWFKKVFKEAEDKNRSIPIATSFSES